MATEYKINYAGNVTPLEVVTLADGTTKLQAINSIIDKKFSSGIEKSFGSFTTQVIYTQHNTLSTSETLNIVLSADANLTFLYIGIVAALSSGVPLVILGVDGTPVARLEGVGDFMVLPLDTIDPTTITITSSGATNIAKVDILAGCEN